MSRRRKAIFLALALFVALAGGVLWVWNYQPAFYRTALTRFDSADERERQAAQFTLAVSQLADEALHRERWSQQFSEESVNGWLAEELPTHFAELLPAGIEQPRVRFDQDVLQVGFRARRGVWSWVVSARLQVWVAQPNQLACEIRSLCAGLVPIPADDVLQGLVEDLNRAGWRVEWKSGDGADVLLISLDPETQTEGRARSVLEALEIVPGKLRVSGRRTTPTNRGNGAAISQGADSEALRK